MVNAYTQHSYSITFVMTSVEIQKIHFWLNK